MLSWSLAPYRTALLRSSFRLQLASEFPLATSKAMSNLISPHPFNKRLVTGKPELVFMSPTQAINHARLESVT